MTDDSGGIPRAEALDYVESVVETVEDERMPVPVREVWVYGDVALGLDPVERVNVYVTKDMLVGDRQDPDADAEFRAAHGVEGVGTTVRADWAREHPDLLRTNDGGHVAPEKCLAAHLLPSDAPVHLEVCNTSFEDNVTQRLRGAMARDAYHEILDPRAALLWVDDGTETGQCSEDAMAKLRDSAFAFPKLSEALAMLGVDGGEAERAARALHDHRADQEGMTVRGDVV
ncbi:MAG: hypothetical protein V5A23_08775 [Halobacteriales archaeon]